MTEIAVPHFKQPLLRTPFHGRARALSQVDSFIPWAGYTTVDVFTTMEQEYFAIRNATTLYDLTPMVKYRVAGPDALPYLNRLVTRDLAKLKPDRVAYCVWCNDAGHLIDDGTVFRLSGGEYRICTAERQIDWFLDSAIGFDVEIGEVPVRHQPLAHQSFTPVDDVRVPTRWHDKRRRPEHQAHTIERHDSRENQIGRPQRL